MGNKEKKKSEHLGTIVAILIMVIIGVAIVYGVNIQKNTQEKMRLRNEGITLYNQGKYLESAALLRESIHEIAPFAQPLDRDTKLYLADCYFLLEQYDLAIREYQDLLAVEEAQVVYLRNQIQMAEGMIAYQEGRYEEALPVFEHAVEQGHMECALYAGVCMEQLGRMEEMAAYLTMYLEYDPEDMYACTELADYYYQIGNYETCGNYINRGMTAGNSYGYESLQYLEILYYEAMHDYNQAYTLIKAYMERYTITEEVQQEYDFLKYRQTLEEV